MNAGCRLQRPRILVADDEPMPLELTRVVLERNGYEVEAVHGGAEAVQILASHGADVVVSDLMMPGVDGLQVLEWARRNAPRTKVVLVTAHGDVRTAVTAVKRGAFDFVTKPFEMETLLEIIARACDGAPPARSDLHPETASALEALVGEDPAIASLRQRLRAAAQSDVTVLIQGETGTGKELVARALHAAGPRWNQPFVATNCAALPETLIASELFGHERGAFTSAQETRAGRFEAANHGTLFLDEIGDLPLAAQGSLLRVLQERRFERVGSCRSLEVDVRVVAATRFDLSQRMSEQRFREDLFFRLAVVVLHCPPLRQRRGDIPLLARRFLERWRSRGPGGEYTLTTEAEAKLQAYDWPGNVRELENILARACVVAPGERIRAQDLEFGTDAAGNGLRSLRLCDAEREHIRSVLDRHAWNRSVAARALGIDRVTLIRKIARLGLSPPSP